MDRLRLQLEASELAEENQEQKLFDKLQKLKTDLSKFQEEQRKILADTEAIDKKDPEDWTDAELSFSTARAAGSSRSTTSARSGLASSRTI